MNAFCGDVYLEAEVRSLVECFAVRSIIETGTYDGRTTTALASMGVPVHTIEIDPAWAEEARSVLAPLASVTQHVGDSRVVIRRIIGTMPRPTLYYLDAHWGEDNPLLGELQVITECDPSPIIILHDFRVPGADFGYDEYGGQAYEFEWVERILKRIRSPWTYYYNTRATGHARGVLFVIPDAHNTDHVRQREVRVGDAAAGRVRAPVL